MESGAILIIEPNDAVRRTLGRMLARIGRRLIVGTAGLQALRQMADDGSVGVLLLDTDIRDMGWRDVVRQTRSAHPEISIILMSVRDDPRLGDASAEERPDVFLGKPFGIASMLAALTD